jgi:hypothetical protein
MATCVAAGVAAEVAVPQRCPRVSADRSSSSPVAVVAAAAAAGSPASAVVRVALVAAVPQAGEMDPARPLDPVARVAPLAPQTDLTPGAPVFIAAPAGAAEEAEEPRGPRAEPLVALVVWGPEAAAVAGPGQTTCPMPSAIRLFPHRRREPVPTALSPSLTRHRLAPTPPMSSGARVSVI